MSTVMQTSFKENIPQLKYVSSVPLGVFDASYAEDLTIVEQESQAKSTLIRSLLGKDENLARSPPFLHRNLRAVHSWMFYKESRRKPMRPKVSEDRVSFPMH